MHKNRKETAFFFFCIWFIHKNRKEIELLSFAGKKGTKACVQFLGTNSSWIQEVHTAVPKNVMQQLK
jgi:hypothetical protein